MKKQHKRLAIIVLAAVLLLLVPLVAMQFTNEVNWPLFDFMAAAVLLLCTGLLCELVLRKVKKNNAPCCHLCSATGNTAPDLGRTGSWYFGVANWWTVAHCSAGIWIAFFQLIKPLAASLSSRANILYLRVAGNASRQLLNRPPTNSCRNTNE